ncbi:hypothetical protein [Psychromonas sp. KJ10-2]|uniref:hypothetical protein n=1 Tax=Psychromonas sp. KJ10-2 TaxID=3391822 RepID=UPI0039B69AC8
MTGEKSESMKLEAWNWIFAEDDDSPFSAQICAQCSGYNLEELQNLLRYVNRPSK